MKRADKLKSVLLVSSIAFAQSADLPVPRDLEASLKQRGYQERFLPVQTETLEPTAEEARRGWLLYQRNRNYEVLPNSRPAPSERLTTLRIVATPGEIESQPFSVYALRDQSAIGISGTDFSLSSADLKVEDVLFHPIQYTISKTSRHDEARGAGGKTYLRYPVFLRPAARHAVPAQSSRLYWVTVAIPETAAAGVHRGGITLVDGAGQRVTLPVEVEVLPFRLTTRNLPRFGAFLSAAPVARGEWAFMKRYGLDAAQWFWNAHPIRIRNENGMPRMDFTEYDAAVKGMKDAGMRGPLVLSLGNSWLGHYEIELAKALGLRLMNREMEGRKVTLMDMTDPRWEKPYLEGLRQIFEHARTAQWPPLALLINDEPTKHIMAYHPYRYHLIKTHFPEVPVYGVFFQPEKDPGPLLHSSDIVVANRDLDRMQRLAREFGKRFWTYNNVTADESFGKIRVLYGQIPAYYGSEAMWFWCWNYWVGNAWDDFDREQSDADWVAVYPSVDGVEPARTLAIEAAREAIDDVRYLKTLEETLSARDPERWRRLSAEIRARQKAIFDGIRLDERINSDADFFVTAANDAAESLRALAIAELRK